MVRHEAIEVDGGWRLRIEVDAPDGFFHRDGSVLNLFFGSSVRLGATLDWDPDTGAFATPNQIVFDTLLTHEEVDLLRGHLN